MTTNMTDAFQMAVKEPTPMDVPSFQHRAAAIVGAQNVLGKF